ncbi:MAG TPA: alpha/beta hydrolase [Caulobacteraceae bacterium]|nr:alpha/beta hydrolase [Caulobacteraceae bacterium]
MRLRAALFAADRPRGSVVLSPGRTEAIEKYYEVVEDLRVRGFTVLVHDWRGQGLSQRLVSDPLRGHGGSWRAYLADFRRLLDAFETRLPRPWIALGHSMGGGLTALALAEGEARFAAAALTSPMLGVQIGRVWLARIVTWWMLRLGRAADYAAGPGDPLGGRFEQNQLTHDRARWERTHALLVAHPELQLGHVTWGWLDFAISASERMAAMAAGALSLPLLVALAEEERLVDNAAARAFAAKVEGSERLEIAGSFHEILMETDGRRDLFWAAFDGLAGRVVSKGSKT